MSFTCLRTRQRLGAAFAVVLSLSAFSGCASSPASSPIPAGVSVARSLGVKPNGSTYDFKTINAPADPTTEILGINNLDKLCGFYGDPHIGFVVRPPYTPTKFLKETYPGAKNTVVAAINNNDTIAGWYQDPGGEIYGFTEWQGIWTKYQDSHELHAGSDQVTVLLGLSDDDLAVGYYRDSEKLDHSFELTLPTGKYQAIKPPNAKSSAATGINGKGDIVGWLTLANGTTEGWLLKGGEFTVFQYPAAVATQPYALDWNDDIVGSYQDASSKTHGFVLTDPLASQSWTSVDDPDANGGETVVAGINNHHTLVGYYQPPRGEINGFMATPSK
jgi:hypothetical protein